MYATVRVLRNLMYAACTRGANLQRLCAALGITPEDLQDVERRIEGVQPVIDMWAEAMASTGDPNIGLHSGLGNNPSVFGLLGYLMQSCRTMKDTYEELERYQEMVSGWIRYKILVDKHECVLKFSVDPEWYTISPETARQGVEASMTASLSFIYILTGKKTGPLKAELICPSTSFIATYERAFNCPVTVGHNENRLIYERSFADTPVISHDQSLYVYFTETLREKAAALDKSGNFCDKVRQVIMRDFMGKIPSLQMIAAHMNMSERSFQRKLNDSKETYRSLGTAIKRDLALNLLRNNDLKVHAVSDVLGYAEPSAFHRAFKTWTKTTPKQRDPS